MESSLRLRKNIQAGQAVHDMKKITILLTFLIFPLSAYALIDSSVKIVKSDGTIGTTNKASGSAWGAEAYTTYGSSSDLWGETWAYTDINDVDFGVVISTLGQDGNTPNAEIDHIRITVYYTEAAGETSVSQTLSITNSSVSITGGSL